MTENYGVLWLDKYSDVPDIENSRSWVLALKGLSVEQINNGLQQVIEQCLEFPPSPPKFRGLCLKIDSKEADELFYQVINWRQLEQEKKTREGLFIIRNLEDPALFKTLNAAKARDMFNKSYEKMMQHLRNGGELPEFDKEIEYKEAPPLDKAELRDKLKDILNLI